MFKGITIRLDEVQGFILNLTIAGLRDFEVSNQVLSLALQELAEQLENEGV